MIPCLLLLLVTQQTLSFYHGNLYSKIVRHKFLDDEINKHLPKITNTIKATYVSLGKTKMLARCSLVNCAGSADTSNTSSTQVFTELCGKQSILIHPGYFIQNPIIKSWNIMMDSFLNIHLTLVKFSVPMLTKNCQLNHMVLSLLDKSKNQYYYKLCGQRLAESFYSSGNINMKMKVEILPYRATFCFAYQVGSYHMIHTSYFINNNNVMDKLYNDLLLSKYEIFPHPQEYFTMYKIPVPVRHSFLIQTRSLSLKSTHLRIKLDKHVKLNLHDGPGVLSPIVKYNRSQTELQFESMFYAFIDLYLPENENVTAYAEHQIIRWFDSDRKLRNKVKEHEKYYACNNKVVHLSLHHDDFTLDSRSDIGRNVWCLFTIYRSEHHPLFIDHFHFKGPSIEYHLNLACQYGGLFMQTESSLEYAALCEEYADYREHEILSTNTQDVSVILILFFSGYSEGKITIKQIKGKPVHSHLITQRRLDCSHKSCHLQKQVWTEDISFSSTYVVHNIQRLQIVFPFYGLMVDRKYFSREEITLTIIAGINQQEFVLGNILLVINLTSNSINNLDCDHLLNMYSLQQHDKILYNASTSHTFYKNWTLPQTRFINITFYFCAAQLFTNPIMVNIKIEKLKVCGAIEKKKDIEEIDEKCQYVEFSHKLQSIELITPLGSEMELSLSDTCPIKHCIVTNVTVTYYNGCCCLFKYINIFLVKRPLYLPLAKVSISWQIPDNCMDQLEKSNCNFILKPDRARFEKILTFLNVNQPPVVEKNHTFTRTFQSYQEIIFPQR